MSPDSNYWSVRVEYLFIDSYSSFRIALLYPVCQGKMIFCYTDIILFLIHPAEQFTLLIIHYVEINHDFDY